MPETGSGSAGGGTPDGAVLPLAGLGRFLDEISRRRVWRTLFAYAAVVFVLLQLGEIILPAFGAPEWALRLLVVLSFLGFPLTLTLAWVFDVTPEGIHRTDEPVERGTSAEPGGAYLPRLALLAVTLATVGGVGWWSVRDTLTTEGDTTRADPSSPAAAFSEDPVLNVQSLAVLPLDDFSQEEGGEHFTAGFHDELIAQLSRMGAGQVISRTSVMQYDRTGKAMPAIAAELGVDAVLEGSVFRAGNRVRITVQLIHGPTDQHLWAESYDGTLEDPIALQREVASAIAQDIRNHLHREQATKGVEDRMAHTPMARREYLRGRLDLSRATPRDLRSASEHYLAALAEDSTYAPAHAGLAATRFLQEWSRAGSAKSGAADSVFPEILSHPGIIEPLQMALRFDSTSPEVQAVISTIHEATGRLPAMELPPNITFVAHLDTLVRDTGSLDASQMARELRSVIMSRKEELEDPGAAAKRLVRARNLQLEASFGQAEELLLTLIEEAPGNDEAWKALEQLRITRGDYADVLDARRARRQQKEGSSPEEEASLARLEELLASRGEAGFWAWRLEELETRREAAFAPVGHRVHSHVSWRGTMFPAAYGPPIRSVR